MSASPQSSSSSSSTEWLVQDRLSRENAQSLLDDKDFLPSNKYGDRIGFGRVAAEKEHSNTDDSSEQARIMKPDDPRLTMTYAEFPLSSLDILLDAAVCHLPTTRTTDAHTNINMVDIGSGLGRIVLYSALTRGGGEEGGGNEYNDNTASCNWHIRGIEITSLLHDGALELVQTGIDKGIFDDATDDSSSSCSRNSFSFHLGSVLNNKNDDDDNKDGAEESKSTSFSLKEADIVFSYSTAFKATQFDPEVGALILDSEEWSKPLSEACKNGCVVVTTDKALNPYFGWNVVERIDVPNPEVLGSTGFIHVLEK